AARRHSRSGGRRAGAPTLEERIMAIGYRLSAIGLSAFCIAGAQDTTRLQPMVVTATKVPVSVSSSPVSVSVVNGDDLRRRGVTALTDAIRDLPGVTLAQSGSFGGTTSLFLRGGESKYVKVLIDGVSANDPGGAFDFG